MDKLNAKRTAIRFFDAWKNEEWPVCLSYVQITWKRDADARNNGMWNRIKNMFSKGRSNFTALESLQLRLEDHDISNIHGVEVVNPGDVENSVAKDALVTATFGDGSKGTLKVRLICEKGSYQADPDGTWGVNPNSIRPV